MQEPKNEQQACAAALRVLETRRNEPIKIVAQPDQADRQNEAVEIVAVSASSRFVVEHTRIESFPGQIQDGKQFMDLLDALETSLPPKLAAGTYEVIVPVGVAALVPRKRQQAVRDAIEQWVVDTAPTLALGPDDDDRPDTPWSVTAQPVGAPFEVTLQRRPPDDTTVVFLARFEPPDMEAARRQRVRTALDRKCPKLAAAKIAEGALSVLLLESDDIALANRHVVSAAVIAELQSRTDVPDVVLLAETDRGVSWYLWVIKEGAEQYPDLRHPGPYDVDGRERI